MAKKEPLSLRIARCINNGTFLKKLNSGKGSHTEQKHMNCSDESLMSRILLEGKTASTVYSEEENTGPYQINIILNHIEEIEDWLENGTSETKDFTERPNPGTVVGRGFYHDKKKATLTERNTEAVTIVLQRDETVPELGFSIKTSYPSLYDYQNTKTIPTNVTRILEQTPCYKALTPFQKGYWQYAARYKNFRENCRMEHDADHLTFSFTYGGNYHELKFTPGKSTFTAREGNENGKPVSVHPDFRDGRGTLAVIKKAFPTAGEALRHAMKETCGISEEASQKLFTLKPKPPVLQKTISERAESAAKELKDTGMAKQNGSPAGDDG